MTTNTFGIHQCANSKTIVDVCKAINAIMAIPDYLNLPRFENDMKKRASKFKLKFGMLQGIRCIDGTHIYIKLPIENSQDCYNYKQLSSLNVQAVCDSRGRFIDVECEWPGAVHDGKVFPNSAIGKNLRDNLLPITYSTL